MILAKVIGNVVSTQKQPKLQGYKLLLVREVDFNNKFINEKDTIAIDLTDAGIGEIVLVVSEGEAVKQILGNKSPINTVIIAIVDDIDISEE